MLAMWGAIWVCDRGEVNPEITILNSINHAGNAYLRRLLIECSNHVLRPHGRDSALRQWGLHLAARGGSRPRVRALLP
jgi:transposase